MRVLFNRVVYQNAENGYCIFKYSVKHDDEFYQQAKLGFFDKEKIFTAVGYYLPTASSVEYDFEGEWVKTEKYGYNFEVTSYAPVVPTSETGLIAFLSSGLIKGLGDKTARLIVKTFGMRTLSIFDNSPEELLSIKGISRKKLDKIINSYKSSHAMRDLVSFLAPHNISIHKITQIYQEYGNDSLQIIQQNPYKIQQIDGFGFKTVDAIARHINIAPNDQRRIEAAIEYVLEEAKKNGHLYLEGRELYARVSVTLNEGYAEVVADGDEIKTVVDAMLSSSLIVTDDGAFYLKSCYEAEYHAARHIVRLQKAKGKRIAVTKEDIADTEDALGIALADKQKSAIVMCLQNNVSIVTGGPGTGKTTTLRAVLQLYKKSLKGDIVLMAPTGKAARRMEESTGLPASTIHSALNIYSDDFALTSSSTIKGSFFVIDEFSMVDMFLASRLFSMIESGAKVLLVGDPDQLPSIGPGNVFRELIGCGVIPVATLDVIYRQAENSPIIFNATQINAGNNRLKFNSDFYMAPATQDTAAADAVIRFYKRALEIYGADNVQVLSPYRTKSEAGVNRLNEQIQAVVNPPIIGKREIQHGRKLFRLGDRVMQIKNNNGISNGDVGVISAIDIDEDDEPEVVVSFSGNRTEKYERESLDMLDLAYATSVHKSQGSEYKVVILVMLQSFYVLLKRNLLYTAVTRAKEKVVVIGEREALDICIRRNDIDKRNTRLGNRIVELVVKKRRCES